MAGATLSVLYLGVTMLAVLNQDIQVFMLESQRYWIGFKKNLEKAAEEWKISQNNEWSKSIIFICCMKLVECNFVHWILIIGLNLSYEISKIKIGIKYFLNICFIQFRYIYNFENRNFYMNIWYLKMKK